VQIVYGGVERQCLVHPGALISPRREGAVLAEKSDFPAGLRRLRGLRGGGREHLVVKVYDLTGGNS
jgi:hypothetical protein